MDVSISTLLPDMSDHGDTISSGVFRCGDSDKKLESSIFNSISLGQWESARASFQTLSLSTNPSTRNTTKELLKMLILDAANFWTESPAIPSPHHLSWLALDAYRSFFPDDSDGCLPEYVGKLVQFRLLLYRSKGVISFSSRVANTLCQYHATHVLQISGSNLEVVPQLSTLILSFLHDIITILNPALGHALIMNLTVSSNSSQYVANNESLQFVYLECISECLEVLESLGATEAPENDDDSQYESDQPSSSGLHLTGTERERAVAMIYTLLSMINAGPGMVRFTKKIDTIFHTLLQMSSSSRNVGLPATFEVRCIYACLLGRPNTFLISRLHQVEEFWRSNQVSEGTHQSHVSPASRGSSRDHLHDATTTTNEEDKIGVASHRTRSSDVKYEIAKVEWKDRFYDAMFDHKHLLENVLDRGLQLIYTGKLQELSQLMLKPEFIPLRPVLLLLGWDRYATSGSGRELLDVLWPMEVSMRQSLLFNGCCKLAFQVELVQWCLDKARPHVQSPLSMTLQRAGDLFKGLKSHSTLYVLHHSTPLGSLDPLEVIDILKMRPRVPTRSSLVSPPPQFSRGATPLKSETESSPAPTPLGGETSHRLFTVLKQTALKPEQERDIAIFKSFCALKLIFDAIWNSLQLRNGILPTDCVGAQESTDIKITTSGESSVSGSQVGGEGAGEKQFKRSGQKGPSKAARKLELGSGPDALKSIVEDEDAEEEVDIQKMISTHHRKSVSEKIQEARMYLASIFPLNYRLEILEDVFSLLLLTSEDIRPVKTTMVGEPFTRSLSGSSRCSINISSFITSIKSKHEFLMDEKLALEILDILQDCIRELRAVRYAQGQQTDPSSRDDTNMLPSNAVKSSISDTSLKSRTTKLEQYVNEARWRLQMVSSKQWVTPTNQSFSTGSKEGKLECGCVFDQQNGTSEDTVSEGSESGGDGEGGRGEETKKLKKRRKKSSVVSVEIKEDGSSSVGSFSSSKADTILHPSPVGISRTNSGGRLSSMYGKTSPSPSPSPSVLSSSIPAPRPMSSLSHSHSLKFSPKTKKSISRKSSLPSSRPASGSSNVPSNRGRLSSYLDEDSGDCADVEDRSPNMNAHKRKKRLKSRSSQSANRKRHTQLSDKLEPKASRSSIICWMLASPGSLLRMCLKHSNYMRAYEVLKTLHVEGHFGQDLIQFSEQYEAVIKELTQQSNTNMPTVKRSPGSASSSSHPHSARVSHSNTPPQQVLAGSLDPSHNAPQSSPNMNMSLQLAIMNAKSSYDPLQSVYQLLAPSSVSQTLFSGDVELEKLAQGSENLQKLASHVPSLVMLDMVCCGRISGHLSKKILEMSVDRLKVDLSKLQDAHGPFMLLKLMSSVSTYFSPPSNFPPLPQTLVSYPHTSPHSLLTLSTHPLIQSSIYEVKFFMEMYRESREKLEAELNLSSTELLASSKSKDIFSQLLQLVAGNGSNTTMTSPPTSSLRQQTPTSGSVFDELVRALHSVPLDRASFSVTQEQPTSRRSSAVSPAHRASGVFLESNHISYLWQFNRYINRLLELLIKCLSMKSSNLGKGSLVLSVLRESPSQMLGRLIFDKGVHPQKLEELLGDFPHLRIVEVLIKCCCPPLPSISRSVKRVPSQPPPIMVLNVGEDQSQVSDPCTFSYELLTQLLQTLKNVCSKSSLQECVLFPKDLANAYRNPQVQEVLAKTPSFASIKLARLSSIIKQMVFYTNVLNCLYIHALMYYFAQSGEVGVMLPGGGVASSEVGGVSPIHPCGLSIQMVQSSRIVQTSLFTKLGYQIGQLGIVSCHDFHHFFLRRGLTPPTLFSKDTNLQLRLPLMRPDPWLKYAPATPDPRLFYIIHDGHMASPPPIPLTIENFESSLSNAEKRYLNTMVNIDVSNKVVTVPKPLFDIRNDFGKSESYEQVNTSVSSSASYGGQVSDMPFFKYIQSNIDTKADILQTLIEASETAKNKKLHLSVQPDEVKLGYDFSSQLGMMVSPRGSPRGRRKRLSRESSLQITPTSGNQIESASRYAFTEEIFEFVKKQAPLLANLVILFCPVKTCAEEVLNEEDKEAVTKEKDEPMTFMKSLRSKVGSPTAPFTSKASLPPKASPILPYEDKKAVTPWKKQYNEVISHFSSSGPMKRFLVTRLCSFTELVPWDSPLEMPLETGSDALSCPKEMNLRKLVAASATSEELGTACTWVMKTLVESGQISKAVLFLSSEPALNHVHEVQFLADMALSCYFVMQYQKMAPIVSPGRNESSEDVDSPVSILSQISDPELATRLTLASLHKWPVDICVNMLSYCLHHLPSSSTLVSPLSRQLEKMRVYSRIMSRCGSPLSFQWLSQKGLWKNWAELAEDSKNKTNYVLRILLESREFELAREWCRVHGLSAAISQQIEVDFLFHLLEGENPNPIFAHQKLDSLQDAKASLEVCEVLLSEKNRTVLTKETEMTKADLKTIIFVLQYMLSRLSISIANKPEYCNKLLGAKALLCLPQGAYRQYKHLIQHPLLLVEQLIMDMKIDWAASVIRELRSNDLLHMLNTTDTPILDHTPMIPEDERGSPDPFYKVLIFYCTRALEFPQPVLIQNTPAQSMIFTASLSPSPQNAGNMHHSKSHARNFSAGTFDQGILDDLGQYPSMTPRRPMYKTRANSGAKMAEPAPVAGFQPPLEPPPREKWEKDAKAKSCRICGVHFGMFMRRHHCRRCGRVICASCSSNSDPVKSYEGCVRVCDTCHNLFSPQNSSTGDTTQAPTAKADDSYYPDQSHPSQLPGLNLTRNQLVPNDLLFNHTLRSEFYYERTPNRTLCLSLADLLVDKQQVARLILDCCHTVSAQLVPDSQGRVNAEVDHHFVIGLIQNLLLNAKLRFLEAGDSSGVELCDTYLSRVDLLYLLVSSRYKRIPSIQELTTSDLARRIRDRLIQDDRFRLAMEVSTKCQLDTSTVWSAWGMAYLKSGQFAAARSKLKHCFQVSSQSKLLGSGGQNAHLLQRIIEQIEQNPLSAASRHTQLSDDWSGVVLGSTAITQRRMDECDLDSVRFKECMYYLRAYGSHTASIAFFTKHSCWKEACKFLLDNNCSADVFVEHLWVPVLKSGQAEQVMACMKELNPSMVAWEQYLTAACRFFSNKSLYSVLLTTQLFMNDYIRAGMTCIKFFIGFSGRATTIADLYGRLHYLVQASRHFQVGLENRRMSDRGRSTRSRFQQSLDDSGGTRSHSTAGIKSMKPSEIQTHLDTIGLQRKVVNHLYQSAQALGTVQDPLGSSGGEFKSPRPLPSPSASPSSSSSSSPSSSSSQQPATLFSNTHVRGEVAAQVMTCSRDLAEGFAIAKEIIEIYRLNSRQVYCDTSRGLAQRQRYNDIRILVQSIQKQHKGPGRSSFESLNDDIIMAAIKVLADQSKEMKQVDKLVQMLTSDRSKIKALVQCGKLKGAYLIAIKSKLVEEVRHISEIASKAGQSGVRDICEKWLQLNTANK